MNLSATGQAFVTPHTWTTRYSKGLLEDRKQGTQKHDVKDRTVYKGKDKGTASPLDQGVNSLSISSPGQV